MNPFAQDATVGMVAASGTLRVTITPPRKWVWMVFEAAGIAAFAMYASRGWPLMSLLFRGLLVWALVSLVIAFFYQLSGSEVVEFDSRSLRISKEILGWSRISEHRLEDISELQWREHSEGDHYGLQCKAGWRTVKFGRYLSEQQAIEVLAALQESLPDVAQKLCAERHTSKSRFITLGLN